MSGELDKYAAQARAAASEDEGELDSFVANNVEVRRSVPWALLIGVGALAAAGTVALIWFL